ncbi:hypothetical protein BTE56_23030 [Agrobacterium pusense]|nr:hypothetical protein BTE56_23030 [Agrobacterium pusense]SDF46991.1 hypothetical protein SAMN05421750_113122 [Agrobacterium pusense]
MHSRNARSGRNKLMLRLPELRQQLRDHLGDTLAEICESYDLATTALEQLRLKPSADVYKIYEYEELCSEIEQEVTRYFAEMSKSTVRF